MADRQRGQFIENFRKTHVAIQVWGIPELIYLVIEDNSTTVVRFKSCVEDAKKLLNFLGLIVGRLADSSLVNSVTDVDRQEIERLLYNFEILFKQECAELGTFSVSKKGVLSTSALIEHAEEVFTDDEVGQIIASTPQAIYDIKRSGRCIAFELPTAAGFHAFRALESVVLDYLNGLGKKPAKPYERNLGKYIDLLKENGAEEKTCTSLRLLKDNYRNPLFHPTDNLEVGEDIGVFNLVAVSISAILKEMEKRKLPLNRSGVN